MNTKILTLLTVFGLLVAVVPVMAADLGVTFTVNEVDDTSFSVSQTTLTFTGTAGQTDLVSASQNGNNKINNTGNVAQNFSVNYTKGADPSPSALKIGSSVTVNDAQNVGSAPIWIWTNIPKLGDPGNEVDIYAWADYSSLTSGSGAGVVSINSKKYGT